MEIKDSVSEGLFVINMHGIYTVSLHSHLQELPLTYILTEEAL